MIELVGGLWVVIRRCPGHGHGHGPRGLAPRDIRLRLRTWYLGETGAWEIWRGGTFWQRYFPSDWSWIRARAWIAADADVSAVAVSDGQSRLSGCCPDSVEWCCAA